MIPPEIRHIILRYQAIFRLLPPLANFGARALATVRMTTTTMTIAVRLVGSWPWTMPMLPVKLLASGIVAVEPVLTKAPWGDAEAFPKSTEPNLELKPMMM